MQASAVGIGSRWEGRTNISAQIGNQQQKKVMIPLKSNLVNQWILLVFLTGAWVKYSLSEQKKLFKDSCITKKSHYECWDPGAFTQLKMSESVFSRGPSWPDLCPGISAALCFLDSSACPSLNWHGWSLPFLDNTANLNFFQADRLAWGVSQQSLLPIWAWGGRGLVHLFSSRNYLNLLQCLKEPPYSRKCFIFPWNILNLTGWPWWWDMATERKLLCNRKTVLFWSQIVNMKDTGKNQV